MGIHSDIPGNIFTVIRNTLKQSMHLSIPGKPVELGHRHPMYIALDEIKEIFVGMGFQVLGHQPRIWMGSGLYKRCSRRRGQGTAGPLRQI